MVKSPAIVHCMDCPICESSSRVLESRSLDLAVPMMRRRRICTNGHRFTAWESTRFPYVRKRNGQLVEFSEEKLRRGVLAATAALPKGAWGDGDSPERLAEEIVCDVMAKVEIVPKIDNDAMSTRDIGERVLEYLHDRDLSGISYWRFASVFLRDEGYKDVGELTEAIRQRHEQLSLWVIKSRTMTHLGEDVLKQPFSYYKLRRAIEAAFSRSEEDRVSVEELLQAIGGEVREKAIAVEPTLAESSNIDADLSEHYRTAEKGETEQRLEIDSEEIGKIALSHIKRKSRFAWARFLSVYNDYGDDFERYVADLLVKES
jgi:transcriptional regulator NrdR family protein